MMHAWRPGAATTAPESAQEIEILAQRVLQLELANTNLQELLRQRDLDAEFGKRVQQSTLYVSGTDSGKRFHFFKKCADADPREVDLCGTCAKRLGLNL